MGVSYLRVDISIKATTMLASQNFFTVNLLFGLGKSLRVRNSIFSVNSCSSNSTPRSAQSRVDLYFHEQISLNKVWMYVSEVVKRYNSYISMIIQTQILIYKVCRLKPNSMFVMFCKVYFVLIEFHRLIETSYL